MNLDAERSCVSNILQVFSLFTPKKEEKRSGQKQPPIFHTPNSASSSPSKCATDINNKSIKRGSVPLTASPRQNEEKVKTRTYSGNFENFSDEIQFGNLQKFQRELRAGIPVMKHQSNAESVQIILSCNSKFDSIVEQACKTGCYVSPVKKITYAVCKNMEIRSGTDLDPESPGFHGSRVLRESNGSLHHSMSIIWPEKSLHVEFGCGQECYEFTEALKLWKSTLC